MREPELLIFNSKEELEEYNKQEQREKEEKRKKEQEQLEKLKELCKKRTPKFISVKYDTEGLHDYNVQWDIEEEDGCPKEEGIWCYEYELSVEGFLTFFNDDMEWENRHFVKSIKVVK